MRPEQQLYLAQLVRQHREELERVVTELHERGEPLTALEAQLIIDRTAVHLDSVENALRHAALTSGARALPAEWLRRILARVRSWTKPRIGRLRHYPPKLLRVPASYLRIRLPEQVPTISIVTPSFQQGRFLERTLYSVVSQAYPSLEYVVQDGGSGDGTLEVLHRYDGVLTAWASEKDSGQACAINRGFRRTTGEIMAWLNSDDLLLPGSLAYVARYFAEHPEVDVVYGNRIMIDEDDGQIGAWILPKHDDLALTLVDYIPQETLFWRRRIWDASGGYVDSSFGYALDWDLLLRFREAGATMVRLPRFLGAFRIHDEQKTTAEDALGFVETTRLRERAHGREVPIEEALERLRPYFARHILVHSWQRFVDRVPLQRLCVTTTPVEPWLRSPVASSSGVTTSSENGAPRLALEPSGGTATRDAHQRATTVESVAREPRPTGSQSSPR